MPGLKLGWRRGSLRGNALLSSMCETEGQAWRFTQRTSVSFHSEGGWQRRRYGSTAEGPYLSQHMPLLPRVLAVSVKSQAAAVDHMPGSRPHTVPHIEQVGVSG